MKIYSILLIIKDCNMILWYYYTNSRISITKNTHNTKCSEDVEKLKLSILFRWECKLIHILWKTQFSKVKYAHTLWSINVPPEYILALSCYVYKQMYKNAHIWIFHNSLMLKTIPKSKKYIGIFTHWKTIWA